MTASNAVAGSEQQLHAYHDGELGWLARRRFERRLAQSPELRRELEALTTLGELARRADAATPAPDLWGDIARRLPGIDREREEARAPSWDFPLVLRPLIATAAVAALVVAVAVGLRTSETGEAAGGGVIRWMDTGPHNVLVLDAEPADATIIWVLDAGREMSQGVGRDVV